MKRVLLTALMFTDGIVMIAESDWKLQQNKDVINEQFKPKSLRINVEKMKTIIISSETHTIKIEGMIIEISGKLAIIRKLQKMFNSTKTKFFGNKQKKGRTDEKVIKPTLIYGSESQMTKKEIVLLTQRRRVSSKKQRGKQEELKLEIKHIKAQ